MSYDSKKSAGRSTAPIKTTVEKGTGATKQPVPATASNQLRLIVNGERGDALNNYSNVLLDPATNARTPDQDGFQTSGRNKRSPKRPTTLV